MDEIARGRSIDINMASTNWPLTGQSGGGDCVSIALSQRRKIKRVSFGERAGRLAHHLARFACERCGSTQSGAAFGVKSENDLKSIGC
jgi:hypothetical protein